MQLPDLGKMAEKTKSDMMEKMGLSQSGLTEEESKEMETRLKNGEMSFDDFLKQVQVMQKTAGLQAMLNKGPFGGGSVSDEQLAEGKKKLQKYGKYVEAMEEGERADPTVLISEATAFKQSSNAADATRLARIGEASGASAEDVGRFVMEFSIMRNAAVRFANGEDPESIKQSMMQQQAETGPALNRKQRRMKAKKTKKKKASTGGFGK